MLPKRSTTRPPAKVQGFTLIEILVALLVLSAGLIGIAALHLSSLQNASSAYHSSLASSIALDFEERLWLELDNLPEGVCVTDADSIAATLQALWRGGNLTDEEGTNTAIPNVRITAGTVSAPAGVNSLSEVSLTIAWDDERFEDTVNPEETFNTFVHRARVPCYRPEVVPPPENGSP